MNYNNTSIDPVIITYDIIKVPNSLTLTSEVAFQVYCLSGKYVEIKFTNQDREKSNVPLDTEDIKDRYWNNWNTLKRNYQNIIKIPINMLK